MSIDLRTDYLGLTLPSPIMASSSPDTGHLDRRVAAFEAGAGAVVLPSIFEEEVEAEEMAHHAGLEFGSGVFGEAADGYLPEPVGYEPSIDRQMKHLAAAVEAVDVPVIGSLNGVSDGGWIRYATKLVDAGAAAIELNLYRMTADAHETGSSVEAGYLSLVEAVRAAVEVPLAVKIGPWFSSVPSMARRFSEAGADGLVLFNRFYQPDLDLDELAPVPLLELSHSWELRPLLRWLAIVRPVVAEQTSLAATSGIGSGADVVKALMVGADIAMMTSALLRHGAGHVGRVEAELVGWLSENDYESVDQLRGSASYATSDRPEGFERANYVATLHSWTAPWHSTRRS